MAKSQREEKSRNPVRKAVHLLGYLIQAPEGAVGVRELARDMDMAPGTVHRVLSALQAEGMVERDASGDRYRLGMEFMRMAWRATSRVPTVVTAGPLMQELVDRYNETVVLGMYSRTRREMMFVSEVETEQPLRYVMPINEWLPIYAGASGLSIMAFLPEQEQEAVIEETGLEAVTTETITDAAALRRELGKVAKQGFAISLGQKIPGAVGIAAPVSRPDGSVWGSLVFTVPEHRYTGENESALATAVMDTANRISERVRGTTTREGPPPGSARHDSLPRAV